MKAISLFSGVGGFEIGFDRAGIETVLQVENDAHALSVLARHWPDTERLTDVRDLSNGDGQQYGEAKRPRDLHPDLIYGGFPCQDVSVAGNRRGLAGDRSGLWFEFHRILSELRPRWAVIENVPGLLSSGSCPCDYCGIAAERIAAHIRDNPEPEGQDRVAHSCDECSAGRRLREDHNGAFKGADFGIILAGLCELGYSVGWAILDAEYFGVPQRRSRVFVIAGPGDASIRSVLSICESCGGNPETGREAREELADTIGTSADRVSGRQGQLAIGRPVTTGGRGFADPDTDTFVTVTGRPYADGGGDENRNLVSETLRNHPRPGSNSVGAITVAPTLRGRESGAGVNMPGRGGEDDANLVEVATDGVRRLTPRECERLMGWPDDWTRYAADGSEIADSHRYRMIGNGVVSTVAEWIGRQIVAVDGAR